MFQGAVDRAVRWLNTMLVVPDGTQGIYERYRVNWRRINPWVRPDCCIESGRAFYAAGQSDKGLALARFVCAMQDTGGGFLDGSFPFYRFRPLDADEKDIGDDFGIPNLPDYRWPNDNGKITELLLWFYRQTGDPHFLETARRALAYLLRAQSTNGAFTHTAQGENPNFNTADFVVWGAAALARAHQMTGEVPYRDGAWKALGWLRDHLHPAGRMKTGYETARFEPWRPPSSETAVALHAFAQGLSVWDDSWLHRCLAALGDTLLAWQHSDGAIRNCDAEACEAALQNDPDMTDLVYTDSYALIALQETHAVTGQARYWEAAERLAAFLVGIQCQSESSLWDGAWRGSYHLERRVWHGAADPSNDLEEGGMNAVYTGWCAAPITYGLLCLADEDRRVVLA